MGFKMILLSLNIRGVGGNPKYLALKICLEIVNLNIIFIQATVVPGFKARELSTKLLKDWKICSGAVRGALIFLGSKKL